MPLVSAKCTNCGANLQVDNTKDAAICQYCGSAYIVEKAITNYNTVNHIHANVVNVYSGNSADFVIRGGVLQKYNGASTHVVIPDNVRCIAKGAFSGSYINHVVIPNSVESIKSDAFSHCVKLQEIHIPDSVIEIMGGAFYCCTSLIHVTLPNKLTQIHGGTFANCINLVSINIPKSIESIATHGTDQYWNNKTSEIYHIEGAFENCPMLVDVNFEDTKIAERLYWHFPNSPIACKIRTKKQEQENKEKTLGWRRSGVCDSCGSSFKGLIIKKCSRCGKLKQY